MGKTKIYDRKKGEYVEGEEIFKERNYNVLKLKDYELQGLLSGNRLMLGQSIEILEEAEKLFKNSLKIFSVSFDALVANPAHFYDKINDVRHHKGQIKIAEEIRYNIYEVKFNLFLLMN